MSGFALKKYGMRERSKHSIDKTVLDKSWWKLNIGEIFMVINYTILYTFIMFETFHK